MYNILLISHSTSFCIHDKKIVVPTYILFPNNLFNRFIYFMFEIIIMSVTLKMNLYDSKISSI